MIEIKNDVDKKINSLIIVFSISMSIACCIYTKKSINISNEIIMYIHYESEALSLCFMHPNGKQPYNVIPLKAYGVQLLQPSHDGNIIAVVVEVSQLGTQIKLLNLDQMSFTTLNRSCTDITFAWSPNANLIAFTVYDHDNNEIGLCIYDVLSGSKRILVHAIEENPITGPLVWSPDGQSIVYENNGSLYSITLKDTLPQLLFKTNFIAIENIFFFNSDSIVVNTVSQIFTLSVKERDTTVIFTNSNHNMMLSPDKKYISFSSLQVEGDSFPIYNYIVSTDGKKQRKIKAVSAELPWSPDGRSIIISEKIGKYVKLFRYDLATNKKYKLISTKIGDDYLPVWFNKLQ